jgi:hypothetical protein
MHLYLSERIHGKLCSLPMYIVVDFIHLYFVRKLFGQIFYPTVIPQILKTTGKHESDWNKIREFCWHLKTKKISLCVKDQVLFTWNTIFVSQCVVRQHPTQLCSVANAPPPFVLYPGGQSCPTNILQYKSSVVDPTRSRPHFLYCSCVENICLTVYWYCFL